MRAAARLGRCRFCIRVSIALSLGAWATASLLTVADTGAAAVAATIIAVLTTGLPMAHGVAYVRRRGTTGIAANSAVAPSTAATDPCGCTGDPLALRTIREPNHGHAPAVETSEPHHW